MSAKRVDGGARGGEQSRGELLDAATEYVLEHGVAGLSFRLLADAVGASQVTLRRHFGSEEELVAEIFDALRAREPIPAAGGGREQLLRDLWARWAEPEGQRQFRLLFEAYGQALMHPDRYRRFLDRVVSDWIGAISQLAVEVGASEREAECFATVLVAQLRGLQLDLLATGDRARTDAAFEAVLVAAKAEIARWTN